MQNEGDWDYSKVNSMDNVGYDNIEEFHAKLKQHGQPVTPTKKFDFDTPILK